jgi:hypothetical protein
MTIAVVDEPPAPRVLDVRPWADPVLDHLGHDPRSRYTEMFWLPLLGPSATFLVRRFADGLEDRPTGFRIAVDDAARMLGLGARGGRRGPFQRTVGRLAMFRLVHLEDDVVLARRRLPGLTRVQATKLPAGLRDAHEAWRAAELKTPALPILRERARSLALTLLQVGEAPEEVRAHLRRLQFHPALTDEALGWAVRRHTGAGARPD